jgi:hypothetical protein
MAASAEQLRALRNLASRTLAELDKAQAANTYPPVHTPLRQYKVKKVEYLNAGGGPQVTGDLIYTGRQMWLGLLHNILGIVSKTDEYTAALETIKHTPYATPAEALGQFVNELAHRKLNKGIPDESIIAMLSERLVTDLTNGAVKCKLCVRLDCILCPTPISLTLDDTSIVIRPTEPDVEEETFQWAAFTYTSIPTAVADIEYLTTKPRDMPKKGEELLALLRLYKSGSMYCQFYSMDVESVTRVGEGGKAGGSPAPSHRLPTITITADEAAKLENFGKEMLKVMPTGFVDPTAEVTSLVIAYQRYCDALVTDGVLERRIATAVMGLEACIWRIKICRASRSAIGRRRSWPSSGMIQLPFGRRLRLATRLEVPLPTAIY